MMKRFASHYLYLTAYGFLRLYIVEINDDGYVSALSPLEEEVESIAWSPGVITLVPRSLLGDKRCEGIDANQRREIIHLFSGSGLIEMKQELPERYKDNIAQFELIALRLYPFDFISMRPVSGTSVQILNNYAF